MSGVNIKHFGKVVAGRIIYYNKPLFDRQVYELESSEVELIIKKKHKAPSPDQYGYYRGGILSACYNSEMFSHLDKQDDIHELYFAPKFLSYTRMCIINGVKKEVVVTRSMADLDRMEVAEFIQKVLAECNELGIEVQPPDAYHLAHYKSINLNQNE